jgi:hypothetical protein
VRDNRFWFFPIAVEGNHSCCLAAGRMTALLLLSKPQSGFPTTAGIYTSYSAATITTAVTADWPLTMFVAVTTAVYIPPAGNIVLWKYQNKNTAFAIVFYR